MERRLILAAKAAEEVAASLQRWLNALPQHATDISGVISELFGVSCAFRTHDNLSLAAGSRAQYARKGGKKIAVVQASMEATTYAAKNMISTLAVLVPSDGRIYKSLWDALCRRFREEGPSFCLRLEWYRVYLNGLFDELKGSAPCGLVL